MAHEPDAPPVHFAFVLTAICIIATLVVGILGLAAYRAVTQELETQHAARQNIKTPAPVLGLEEAMAEVIQESNSN